MVVVCKTIIIIFALMVVHSIIVELIQTNKEIKLREHDEEE